MSESSVWAFVFLVAVIITGMVVLTYAVVTTKSQLECSIEGITYTDVRPYRCWMDSIAPEFCPLPTNVRCSGDFDGLTTSIIVKAMNE